MEPLLLLGGTYDPVHYGHIAVAREVARAFAAPVHLMPAALPPHREAPSARANERMDMLHLASEGYSELIIDDRELRRAEPSWTVETLREVRGGEDALRPVAILVGADAFAHFDTWREWQAILNLAHVVVLARPGAGGVWSQTLRKAIEPRVVGSIESLRIEPYGCVLAFAVTPVAVSSTEVRARLVAGESTEGLLPPAVAAYIAAHRLYCQPA